MALISNNILRVSDDKDLTTDMKTLQKYINAHDTEINNRFQPLWNAYACSARILNKSAVPAKASYKPDYRIAVNYPRYIVDTFTGFARGIAVTATASIEDVEKAAEVNDYIKNIWDENELDDVNAELHRLKCVFGESYQLLYVNEMGDIETVATDPLSAFPIYDNSIRPKLKYFVRTYKNEDNKRYGSISDGTNVYYLDFENGLHVTEYHQHGFDGVPVAVYTMNKARIGLIEPILSMSDAYDKAISEKMNDVDAFSDAIMKVQGVKLDEEQIRDLRDKRVINIAGRDGVDTIVDFMQRPSGDATQEHLLDRLHTLMFIISMVCNVSDPSFATSSGIALRMKMEPMSNLATGDWRQDVASMKNFWRLVFSNPVNSIDVDSWRYMTFSHYLNYPDDVESSTDVAVKLSGVVSKRTQLSILPTSIVPDVELEMETISEEQADASKSVESLQNSNTETETETEDTDADT